MFVPESREYGAWRDTMRFPRMWPPIGVPPGKCTGVMDADKIGSFIEKTARMGRLGRLNALNVGRWLAGGRDGCTKRD